MERKINIKKYLGKFIVTRNSIIDLFSEINNLQEDSIILDFKNVDFISRSAADEYIRNKIILMKSIKEINIDVNIMAMFYLVIEQGRLNKSLINETNQV